MAYDTIFDDSEFAMAFYRIQTQANFLVSCIESYTKIVSDLVVAGFEAEAIDSALLSHVSVIRALSKTIKSGYESISEIPTEARADIEQADDFQYPDSLLETVKSLLAAFL